MLSVFQGSLEEMLMYNLNALKKSKCVKLIPNLTHLKIDFQSALPHVQTYFIYTDYDCKSEHFFKKGDGVEIRITVGLIKPEDIRYLPSYLWQSVNVKKKHPRLGLNIW